MSRLIIKNLPDEIGEEQFRETFSRFGHLTDCCLKYTKDGRFRNFGFVGYESSDLAEKSQTYFHETFIGSKRIQVDFAKAIGDDSKPKAWSKYSVDSSAYQTSLQKQKEEHAKKEKTMEKAKKEGSSKDATSSKKKKKKKIVKETIPDAVADDPAFSEFLQSQRKPGSKTVWSNDAGSTENRVAEVARHPTKQLQYDGATSSDDEEVEMEPPVVEEKKQSSKKSNTAMSDLEYLKAKTIDKSTAEDNASDSTADSGNSSDDSSSESTSESTTLSKAGSKKVEGKSTKVLGKSTAKEDAQKQVAAPPRDRYRVKMRGLPFKVKEKAVREFFAPLVPTGVRIPRSAGRASMGVAFASFGSGEDADAAMLKNKLYLGGRYVELFRNDRKTPDSQTPHADVKHPARPWEAAAARDDGGTESVAESGRLFLRNLAYVVTEDDVEQLLATFGLLSEVSVPVDRLTGRIKGFAFATFMMPEHAVKAYAELDGSVFKGRMLHIIPARPSKSDEVEITPDMPYKLQQQLKQKKMAASAHNWNALFLGANAVADAMAEKYNSSKEQILSSTSKDSAAFKHVPLYLEWAPLDALKPRIAQKAVETDGVTPEDGSTKKKSEEKAKKEGETLSSDEEEEEPEENTTIFVKNLNFDTTKESLQQAFSKCGAIYQVTVATKKDAKAPGRLLSMGYGFVQYYRTRDAKRSIKELQHCALDGHSLELKLSQRATQNDSVHARKKAAKTKQKSAKILIRNIPFEAKHSEVQQLFSTFGELKFVRLPKKMAGTGSHRGFGFAEFVTRHDAKRAFAALAHSTHLYGRRLVLEWADTDESVEQLRKKTADHFYEGTSLVFVTVCRARIVH
ncbi:PREDICTED: probable RNA-binding protein 19 [Priapulus caudatus]|uniref:Probable RNA-binding protein 19 n=1 Tax=Priapulus caudatus TaxID=37621 RepID=A0ABM1E4Q9_PRICU|nr:PREDICTED: probable RNA-binding protein 19 [Priapulus caudatus]